MHAPLAHPATLLLAMLLALLTAAWAACEAPNPHADRTIVHDVVILDGRVLDPESHLDAVRHLGISDGRIQRLSEGPLEGRDTLVANGRVVVPGFIDLHGHGQDDENYELRVRDGVTTALELELGTADVDAWYEVRRSGALVNYGVSAGHVPVRMEVFGDEGERLPVGPAARRAGQAPEIERVVRRIREGLAAGAPAVGLSLQNTPAAGRDEVLGVFQAAADAGVSVHVHIRHMGAHPPDHALAALEEVLGMARETGAALHVAHIHSSGLTQTPALLERLDAARQEGVDVTSEVYPYTAGQTNLEAPLFEPGWQERLGIGYGDLQWTATGERLTAETFQSYRRDGGLVILHMIPEAALRAALERDYVVIASDGLVRDGRGHPRAAGSYARVLGRYVRDESALTLAEAVARMSLEPARRLEAAVPAMGRKGRIAVGADADIVVFDPAEVIDRATYEDPVRPSAGIEHVLVNGTVVLRAGELQPDAGRPGRPIRRPEDHGRTSRAR